MPNTASTVQVSDTTGDAQRDAAGNTIKKNIAQQ